MRMIISSDWHVDAVTAGVRRYDEHFEYVHALEKITRERDIDLLVLLGDFFDPGSMAVHQCERFLFDAVGRLSAFTRVVLIAGNHDVVEGSEHPTTVLSAMRQATSYGFGDGAVTVVEEPGVYDFAAGVRLVCLPYVSRALRYLYAESSWGVWTRAVMDPGDELPRVVCGHLTVAGADLGSESEEFARGTELDFPVDRVAALNPVAVFNGHYHKPQTVKLGGLDIVIPGSPQRLTFAETGDYAKGFLLVDI
jgi:DNA repair exonuclease SbcCD nuclease subunit